MVRFLGAPALALTMMTAAAPVAHAGHWQHHAAYVGHRYYRQAFHHQAFYRYASYRHASYRQARYHQAFDRQVFDRQAFHHDGYRRHASGEAYDGRPRAWCGWYARQIVGQDPGAAFNLARNWAHWGRPTSPHVGAVVVWSHHVGLITGQAGNGQWIVKSGNDGNRVRERPLSVSRAIAFRES